MTAVSVTKERPSYLIRSTPGMSVARCAMNSTTKRTRAMAPRSGTINMFNGTEDGT
jgi:hypothetical protein